jgi:hypothetical protein
MRRARVFLSIPLTAAAAAIFAAPAAAPPGTGTANYGQCVAQGAISPSTSPLGPTGFNNHTPSGFTGAPNGFIQSNQHSRFSGGEACQR